MDALDLDQLGRHLAVRGDHAVADEVAVVGLVVKVAAVRQVALARAIRQNAVGVLPDRLVDPVPDAAARQRVAGVERLPVLLEVPHRVAHRMRVFAQEEGLFRILAALGHPVDGRVHVAVDIHDLVGALVVHRACGVHRLDGIVGRLEVFAGARFVAERPHEDRGMVLVVLDLVDVALDVRLLPRRHMAQ